MKEGERKDVSSHDDIVGWGGSIDEVDEGRAFVVVGKVR